MMSGSQGGSQIFLQAKDGSWNWGESAHPRWAYFGGCQDPTLMPYMGIANCLGISKLMTI